MIHIKLTLHEFIGENMQAGISNMEDIHELMLWSDTFVFRVHKTTVLIQKASFFKCAQRLEVHAFWQKLRKNLTKSYLQFRWGISQAATEFRFWIGAQNFADRLILSAKMKKVKKSASKNKHPIKINLFRGLETQSTNSKKRPFQKIEYLDHVLYVVIF